jgi:membrane protease subunit HflK
LRDLQARLRSAAGGSGGGGGSEAGGTPPDARRWGMIAGLAVLGFLAFDSGFIVDEPEVAVVQRFGRFDRVVRSGLQWRWPRPIESVTRVNISSVNSISYQSRMLTSDVNLVNISAAVQFQYADARLVLFRVREPELTLREVSESAIREIIGQNTLDAVLAGEPRRAITTNTRELIQKTLDGYDAGIRVVSVNLTDVQVPEQVQAAQRDANKAIEDKERLSKEAQAYANDITPRSRGGAQRLLLDAAAYKLQVVANAEGDASRFTQMLTAYLEAPEVTRNRLYVETMETVLARSKKVLVDGKSAGSNILYLPLDKLMGSGSARTGTVTAEPLPDATLAPAVGGGDTRTRERSDR